MVISWAIPYHSLIVSLALKGISRLVMQNIFRHKTFYLAKRYYNEFLVISSSLKKRVHGQ